jgi:hypothetical protein
MIGWIEKNINPPGLHKKNRGALFSVIGKVFGIVKDDAVLSFNAHFPYLADDKKLAEHGRALDIPRFANDGGREFRDRVATASFYHMRTGERGYITEQLAAHFGDRFITKEDFLQIYLQVLDLTDEEISWAGDFLDTTVDPNISLNFGKWKKFVDKSRIKENWNIEIVNKTIDAVLLDAALGIRLNLAFREEIGKAIRYDGRYEYDGSIAYNQNLGFYDAVRVSSVPHSTDRIYHGDAASIGLKLLFKDNPNKEIRYDGKYRYDGAVDYYSGESTADRFSVQVNSKIHDAVKLSERMKSGVTLRPAADAV